jgi:cell wall-associated NlpC family hydrolase
MSNIHNLNNKSNSNHRLNLIKFNTIGVTSFVLSMALLGANGSVANATPIESYPPAVTEPISLPTQTIKVSTASAPIAVNEDNWSSTSADEIAALEAAEAAEAAKKAAEEALTLINSRISSNGSNPLPVGVAPGQIIPADGIIAAAQQWVGVVPYGGGNHPSDTFSCDGYVQYVFAQNGINLPRGAGAQASRGTQISKADAKAGDLIYWSEGHIGIYDGAGGMYDSPMAGRMVQHRVGSIWGNPVFIRL